MYCRITYERNGIEGIYEFDTVGTLTEAQRKAHRELKGATILKIETPSKVKLGREKVEKKEVDKSVRRQVSMRGRPSKKRKRK